MNLHDKIARAATLAAAISEIIDFNKPTTEPETEDYDDTESAFNNGDECARWEMAGQLEYAIAQHTRGPRLATATERRMILLTYVMATDSTTPPEVALRDLPDCEVYMRENYITDCPGYAGPVAIIHWGGGPAALDVLTLDPKRPHAWRLERREP